MGAADGERHAHGSADHGDGGSEDGGGSAYSHDASTRDTLDRLPLRTWDNGGVRMTEFWRRMERQFGPAYADSYARDQVLPELGGRTVHEALAAGEDAKDVWRAVCEAAQVPARER